MILGFKTENNGKPTGFVDKILQGSKIHTIRVGNRWKPGNSIQMATGVRTRNYKQFNKGIDGLGECVSVQRIQFFWREGIKQGDYLVKIDGKELSHGEVEILAKNDGFDSATDLFRWFNYEPFEGQIIHWTNKKY